MNGLSGIRARTAPDALVILGEPVAHSLSPVFQGAALVATGRSLIYTRREVSAARLVEVLEACRVGNIGGNVTMPHKAAVRSLADVCSPLAARTGAVNTFWWDEGRLIGHNTDVEGIAATLRALGLPGQGGDVVVLGAGGSAGAVLVALEPYLAAADRRVLVAARTPARAEALVAHVQVPSAIVVASTSDIDWSSVALVVNATPAGMRADDPLPMPLTMLAPHTAVFDLVYSPDGTRWVREARERGLAAEDGLRMLVEQGAAAFECWFGEDAPRSEMWQALGVPMPSPHAARP